jgi:hypothetical protein
MLTIKDGALGKYHIVQDHVGMKVVDGKTTINKVDNLDQALRFIAEKLTVDEDREVTLLEYTQLRGATFQRIIEAQKEKPQEPAVEVETVSAGVETVQVD